MACIAGTVDSPHVWWRFNPPSSDPTDGVRMHGRICTRQADRTNRFKCGSCPAYRGVIWTGALATGISPKGDFYALSGDEYRQLAAWQAKADEDFEELSQAYWDFIDYMAAGKRGAVYGMDTLRRIGDEEAMATFNARRNARRAADGGAYRAYMRDFMRAKRAREKAARLLGCVHTAPESGELSSSSRLSRVRARARGDTQPNSGGQS